MCVEPCWVPSSEPVAPSPPSNRYRRLRLLFSMTIHTQAAARVVQIVTQTARTNPRRRRHPGPLRRVDGGLVHLDDSRAREGGPGSAPRKRHVRHRRSRRASRERPRCPTTVRRGSAAQLAHAPRQSAARPAHTPPNSRVLGGMPSTDEKGCPLPTAAKTLHTTTSSESTRAAARVRGAGASPAHTADSLHGSSFKTTSTTYLTNFPKYHDNRYYLLGTRRT